MTVDAVADNAPSGPARSLTRSQRAILMVGLVCYGMGSTMLFAILPPASRDLGLTEIEVGIVISLAAAGFVLVTPIWGRLSDRVGRKPVFVTGLAGYAVMTLAFTLALEAGYAGLIAGTGLLAALIVARIAFAAASGGVQPSASAMFADTSSAAGRSAAMAQVGAAFAIGSILGPAVVGLATPFGLLTPLYAISALVAFAAASAWFLLPETRQAVEAGTAMRVSPADPRLRAPLLMLMLAYLCVAMHQQTTGFFLQDRLGLSGAQTAQFVGFGYVALGVAMVLAQGVVVQLLRPSPALLMSVGFPIAACGYVVLLATDGIAVFVTGMAVAGFGFGLAVAGLNATISLRVTAHEQGAALGLASAAPAVGFLAGPLIGAALYATQQTLPFTAIATVLGALAVAAVFAGRGPRGSDFGRA